MITPSQILINPEYARLLPKVSESQYEEIKYDIQTNGQPRVMLVRELIDAGIASPESRSEFPNIGIDEK